MRVCGRADVGDAGAVLLDAVGRREDAQQAGAIQKSMSLKYEPVSVLRLLLDTASHRKRVLD